MINRFIRYFTSFANFKSGKDIASQLNNFMNEIKAVQKAKLDMKILHKA